MIKKIAACGVSALALIVAGPLHAQAVSSGATPPAAGVKTDDTVVIVTAQKRAQRLQDVPASVQAVQGKKIDDLKIETFQDVQQLTPGLSLTTTQTGAAGIVLRGVGFDPTSGTQPTVNVYFNETPLDTQSAFKALYDIGQIEVLRGPQGTLRGQTSPSGAITIATQAPSLKSYNGYFEESLSDRGLENTQIAANFPIIKDVLALRIAALSDNNRGADTVNYHTGEHDNGHTRSGRATLLFKPMDTLKIQATVQQLNENRVQQAIVETIPGRTTAPMLSPYDRTSVIWGPDTNQYHGTLGTLTADWNLDLGTLSYVGGYQNIVSGSQHDTNTGGYIPNYSIPQLVHTDQRQASHELRFASNNNHFWNWLFGAYYSDSHSGANSSVLTHSVLSFGLNGKNIPSPFAILNIHVITPSSNKNMAFFTDQRFKITSNDEIEAGLRYQSQKVVNVFDLSIAGPALGPNPILQHGIPVADQHKTYDATTGLVSWRHTFNHDLTGYVTYGTSYRPGGAMFATATIAEDLLTFKPEHSSSLEAGLKGSAFENKLSFSADVYHQKFKNYQAYTGGAVDVSQAANGAVDNTVQFTFNTNAVVDGVELEVNARPIEGLQMGVSGTYNSSKFDGASKAPCNDFNGDGVPDSTGTPSVPAGKQVAFCTLTGSLSSQAPWSATAYAEYTKDIGNNEYFIRGLETVYPNRKDPFSSISYKGYATTNLYVGTRFLAENLELSFWAKNLFDTKAVTFQSPEEVDYGHFATGYYLVNVLNQRELGLTLKANF